MLTEKQIRAIAKATFNPRGRKFRIVERRSYTMENYWDGGTREYAVALDLATGETREPSTLTTNPMRSQAHAEFEIPQGIGILVHGIYCGKDCGITLYVPPKAMRALPNHERWESTTVEIPAITITEARAQISAEIRREE